MKESELKRIKNELLGSIDEKVDDAIPHLPDNADGFHIRALVDEMVGRPDLQRFQDAKNDIIQSRCRL